MPILNEVTESVDAEERLIEKIRTFSQWLKYDEIPLNDLEAEIVGRFERAGGGGDAVGEAIPIPLRVAPSIVARSDCQIMGLSYPRMAGRAYLGGDFRSFVNLRKRKCLLQGSSRYVSQRHPMGSQWDPDFELVEINSNFLRSLIQRSPVFADWVLQTPKRLSEHHILDVGLGLDYGEDCDFRAVPYVQPLHCSGACVQSMLQLVAIFLQEYASFVMGIAEVSSTCFNWTQKAEHRLDYISDNQISVFAKQTELFAFKQAPDFSSNRQRSEIDIFHHGISSYILSGFPVGVPVDLGRLLSFNREIIGKYDATPRQCELQPPVDVFPFYEARKKRAILAASRADHNSHHVLIIGCVSKSNDGDAESHSRLVMHDPATRPFVEVDSSDLFISGTYSGPTSLEVNTGVFTAFTPNKVQMSLHRYRHVIDTSGDGTTFTHQLVPGVVDLSRSLFLRDRSLAGRTSRYDLNLLPAVDLVQYPDPEFRLVRAGELVDSAKRTGKYAGHADVYSSLGNLCSPEGPIISSDHWVWIQVFPTSIWVWNAETSLLHLQPDAAVKWGEHLLYAGGSVTIGGEFTEFQATENQEVEIKKFQKTSTLSFDEEFAAANFYDVGVITSAVNGDLRSSLDSIPDNCEYIDLYSFKQADVEGEIFDGLATGVDGRATHSLEAVASLFDKESLIMKLAERIHSIVTSHRISRKIRGMASFLPEILSQDGDESQLGIQALITLRKLGANLKHLGHDVDSIEMVSGSKINGIWQGQRKTVPFDSATLVNGGVPDAQREKFHKALKKVVDETVNGGLSVPLAIELEPGPLSFINDLSSLNKLINALDSDAVLQREVGINLDLSHWILAGIQPEDVDNRILSRVTGVHLNNHTKGHFGDVAFGTFDLNPGWRRVFKALICEKEREAHLPVYNGYVAIELEGAKDPSHVAKSFEAVIDYLQ